MSTYRKYQKPGVDSSSGAFAFSLLLLALAGFALLRGDHFTFIQGPTSPIERAVAMPTYWAYQLLQDRTLGNIAVGVVYSLAIVFVVLRGSRTVKQTFVVQREWKKQLTDAYYRLQANRAAKKMESRADRMRDLQEEESIREEARRAFRNSIPREDLLKEEIEKVRLRRDATKASETDAERITRLTQEQRERHDIMEKIRREEPLDKKIDRFLSDEIARNEAKERAQNGIPHDVQVARATRAEQVRHEAREAVRMSEPEDAQIERELSRMRIREKAKIRLRKQHEQERMNRPR